MKRLRAKGGPFVLWPWLTFCRIGLLKPFFSLNIFVDLSWLQLDLTGLFYATILLLVLHDFYSRLLQELRSYNFPCSFSVTSKALYSLILQCCICVPMLPYDWPSYVPAPDFP